MHAYDPTLDRRHAWGGACSQHTNAHHAHTNCFCAQHTNAHRGHTNCPRAQHTHAHHAHTNCSRAQTTAPSAHRAHGAQPDTWQQRGACSSDSRDERDAPAHGQAGPLRTYVLFYGGRRHRPDGAGLDTCLDRRGWEGETVDLMNDAIGQDLRSPDVLEGYVDRILRRQFDLSTLAPVCTSLSQARQPAVRDADNSWGRPLRLLPPRIGGQATVDYLESHNAMLRGFFTLLCAVTTAGIEFIVEQPADLRPQRMPDGTINPFHSNRGANSAHLFRFKEWLAAVAATHGKYVPVKQCPWGALSQKPTWLFMTSRLAIALGYMRDVPCTCIRHVRLRGRDKSGALRTRAAQVWTGAFNDCIAQGADEAVGGAQDARGTNAAQVAAAEMCEDAQISDSSSVTDSDDSEGEEDTSPAVPATGELRAGPALDPRMRAAVELAREAPPRWASRRRLDAAGPDELRRRSFPHTPAQPRADLPTARVAGQPYGFPDATAHPIYNERPKGRIWIWDLYLDANDVELDRSWITSATRALRERTRGPATRTYGQEQLQTWARGIIWDCRNPYDCVPLEPSTADDQMPGPQLDRTEFRAMAARHGMAESPIVRQVGHGGVEACATLTLDTVLAYPHTGVLDNFEAADEVIQGNLQKDFISGAFELPPFVPMRLCPRNVVMQERARLRDDGSLEWYMKPRVTFNLSYGISDPGAPRAATRQQKMKVPSPNGGVPSAATSIGLPTTTDFGEGAAIVDAMAAEEPTVHAEAAGADISDAYSWLLQQRLDWWFQCFLWAGGVHISYRVVFGGAFAPQAFCATMTVPQAEIDAHLDAIEVAHPPPHSVQRVCDERRRLQRAGALPPGAEQQRSRYMQWYLDDASIAALNDRIPTPAHLQHIATQHEAATRAHGGTPSAEGSRILVYVRQLIHTLQQLGFHVAVAKTQSGDIIIILGARARLRDGQLDIPPAKQTVLLTTASATLAALAAQEALERKPLEKLVGRLGSVAQVEPALLLWLHAGYAVVCARTRSRGLPPRRVHLRRGGRRERELSFLLEMAIAVIGANEGIPMAAAEFPELGAAGVVTVVTDASLQPHAQAGEADDGVGGFAFSPDAPNCVFMMSEPWPPEVRLALLRGAARAAERPAGPATGMPTAETFGSYALADAVRRRLGTRAIIAVGDCAPSAVAITAGTSASAQTRELLRAIHAITHRSVGVDVPREWNTSADCLSHPSQLRAVFADVPHHFRAERLHIHPEAWATLERAIALPMARAERDAAREGRRVVVCRWSQCPHDHELADVRRPHPLGNPWTVLRRGRLATEWRDALCDAFATALHAAMSGATSDLAAIGTSHGLPQGALQKPYADVAWADYAAAVRSAVDDLRRLTRRGTRVALGCACHPERCHADTIADAVCEDCD